MNTTTQKMVSDNGTLQLENKGLKQRLAEQDNEILELMNDRLDKDFIELLNGKSDKEIIVLLRGKFNR